ncbi:hypothetical protein [Roseomonas gilardii]|uniref:hypothetical protein n=1 Tax=Roseomonas gilardii TaxID=257708 RepID=UPI0011A61B22|nr:hypothetical protein [Roseomonas gilardii]
MSARRPPGVLRRLGRAAAFCLLAAPLAATPAAAVERVATAASGIPAIAVTTQVARVTITLRNPPGAREARLRPEPEFRAIGAGQAVRAEWTQPDTGLSPGEGGVFLLAPGATATFEARGVFPVPGVWEAALSAELGDGRTARFPVTLERSAQPLPADFLADPRTARITLGFWEGSTDGSWRVRLVGRNATAGPFAVAAVSLGRVTSGTGESEGAAALRETANGATPQPGAALDDAACRGARPAGSSCTVILSVPAGLDPGRHVVEVVAAGAEGGQSVRSQPVEVRASAFSAGLLVGLSALLGTLVFFWRQTGRATVEARILVAEAARQADRLGGLSALPAARAAAADLVQRLQQLDAAVLRGTTPDMTLHDARLAAIAAAVKAHAEAERLPPAQRKLLDPAVKALAAALDAAPADMQLQTPRTEAIAAAAQALRADAIAAQRLVEAAGAARGEIEAVGAGLRRLMGKGALSDALRALRVAIDETLDPAEDIPVAARVERLGASRRRLDDALAALPTDLPRAVQALADAAGAERAARFEKPLADAGRFAAALQGKPVAEIRTAANRLAGENAEILPAGVAEAVASPPSVPVLLAPNSALTLDLGWLLTGPAGPASPEMLRAHRVLVDVATNAVVLAAICLVGVLLLWLPNPVWGSWTDIVTALLAGLGTRLAIGAAAART